MKRTLAVLAVVSAAMLAGLASTGFVTPESRIDAAPFPRIDASAFRLTAGSTFDTYGARIRALEGDPALAPKPLTNVLDTANRTGRDLCHGTYLDPALSPKGFCWQDGEDDDENVWVPQGVSGSGDADPSGTIDGRRVVVATWHSEGDQFIRVSFVDLATLKYRHALLVEPTANDNFAAIAGHGHGIFMSGDKLVVATSGSVLRVFDLRHIWAMDTSTGEVGKGTDGKWHARWHAYALPQVGAFWYPGGGGCAQSTGERPCFSSLGLDHSGAGSFVAVEHLQKGGGRIVRWPMDRSTSLPLISSDGLVHAVEAFDSPVWGMQGATSYDGYFVISGVCPWYADNIGDGKDYPSCLHRGVGGDSTTTWTEAPKNAQNLSYWHGQGQLWLLGEQLRERVTVHIPWPG